MTRRARITLAVVFLFLARAAAPASPSSAGHTFDSNGVPIHYIEKGSGVPVVLIHGFTGSADRHWAAPGAVDALASAGYRVIALDCRGHGESGKPLDPNDYGLEMVRDVVRLLDHLHIDRAHIVGYSMGGGIASQLVVKDPKRVLSAILLGSGWEGSDLTDLKTFMAMMADGFEKKDAAPLIRAVTGSPDASASSPEVAAATASLFARNDPHVLAVIARGMAPLFDVPAESLRTTNVPLLAIVGDQDPRNVEGVKRMAAVVTGMEIVTLPGATHATSVKPAIPHMIAFLNEHR